MRNKWTTASMLFALWAVIPSFLAAYCYIQYSDITNRVAGVLIYVNVGVNCDNGTRMLSNDTKTLTGATHFDVTKQVFNVAYEVGIFGTEVISINNFSKEGSYGWTYWMWNSTSVSWSIVWVSADTYKVTNEQTLMWYYQNTFNPPP